MSSSDDRRISFSTPNADPNGVVRVLQKFFNIDCMHDDGRVLVRESDVSRNAQLVQIIRSARNPIDLRATPPKEIFRRLIALRSGSVDEVMPEPPNDLINVRGFGLLTDIELNLRDIALAGPDEIETRFINDLLPFMRDKIKATHVKAITVNSERQQSFISLARTFHLIQEHGLDEAQRLAAEARFLHTILPSGLDPFHYVN